MPDHQLLQIADPGSHRQRISAPLVPSVHSRTIQEQRGPTNSPRPLQRSAVDLEKFSGDPNFMSSLAKGIIVMRQLREHKRLTASELAQQTGLSNPAVRRCLYTLYKLGITICLDRHWCFSDHFQVPSPGPIGEPVRDKRHEFARIAASGQEMRNQDRHNVAERGKARSA